MPPLLGWLSLPAPFIGKATHYKQDCWKHKIKSACLVEKRQLDMCRAKTLNAKDPEGRQAAREAELSEQ